jgi:tetratricopeptide (TPR) repeat protein
MMSTVSRFKGREIFFSYHTYTIGDKKLFQHLMSHLAPLKKEYPDLLWYDSCKISAGSNTIQSLTAHLNAAIIIVLLLSPDYLASKHCDEHEMQPALALAATGSARLIPVLLRPIDQDLSPLARYQPLPSNGVPVSHWSHRDDALLEVAKGIRSVLKELADSRISIPHPTFVTQISYGSNSLFTDRDAVLAKISSSFASAQHHATPILALNGLAGIGKTQIAQAYASRPSLAYQSILWFNASSRALLSKEVSAHAAHLSLPEADEKNENHLFTAFKRWLQERPGWLLVLDFLEDITLLDLIIPQHSRGHVLLTTRMQATGGRASPLTVSSMDINHGALFLLRRATLLAAQASLEEAPQDIADKARAITRALDGFPLALDQAGAYIEETGCDLGTYLDLYHQQRLWLLGQRKSSIDDHHESVIGTLELVFQQFAQQPEASLDLLHFLAFLHPDAISETLLINGLPVLRGTLRALISNPQARHQAFAALLRLSLLYRSPYRAMLQMHRIVQDVLIEKLPIGQQRRWARLAVRLVNHVFPEVHFETWEDCQRYLPHAQHCATLIAKYQLTFKEGALLLERLGRYRFQQAAYLEAETHLMQALTLYERHLRADTLDAAQVMNSLALLHSELAHYQQAKDLHLHALELREQELDAEHPKTVESLHNLAMLYGDQGRYKQAENLYLRVLALEERSKGPEHPDVAKTLNNLGLMYFYQKRYAEAETAYQRALTIYEHTLSADDPDQIHPIDGLGSLAEQQGNFERAEQFYQRALTLSRKTWGEKHPETAHCINKLAGIAESRGDYQQAEERYQQALVIGEQALGSEHPDVALFLNNLAFLAAKQEQYQKAEPLYQRALSIYERSQQAQHPDMALFLNNLARFYRNIHNEERAEALLKRALAIQKEFLDPTDPDITLSLNNLADVLIDQHRDEEAAPFLHRALAILLLRFSGPEHPNVEQIREKYASLLERLHQNKEANELRQISSTQEKQPSTEATSADH